jgi:hypothetical protein
MSTATISTIPARGKQVAKASGRTKVARARDAFEMEKLALERAAVSKVAPRFSAQHKNVLIVLLSLAVFMAASSFITSFNGLFGAAAWAIGDQHPWLQVMPPLMYDVAIIAFTLKLFMDREEGASVISTWSWIAVLASVSALANIFHTLTVTTAVTVPQLVMGCIISGGAPFLLALVVEVAASKVFKKPGVVVSA